MKNTHEHRAPNPEPPDLATSPWISGLYTSLSQSLDVFHQVSGLEFRQNFAVRSSEVASGIFRCAVDSRLESQWSQVIQDAGGRQNFPEPKVRIARI